MELFLMCSIAPGETIGLNELLARLWDRFGLLWAVDRWMNVCFWTIGLSLGP